MDFTITVLFTHKDYSDIDVKANDGFTAIQKALATLDSVEKDNIVGAKITHVY